MFRKVLPVTVVCVMFLLVGAAEAKTYVKFGLSNPGVTFVQPLNELVIENQNYTFASSSLTVQNCDGDTNAVLDSATLTTNGIPWYNDAFYADLYFTQNGPNDWSATGTVSMNDGGIFAPPAMQADFTSTAVWFSGDSTGGYTLGITGLLSLQLGETTMLVNRGQPWVFTGKTSGTPDGDGNPLTVTAGEGPWYSGGTITFLSTLTADDLGEVGSLDEALATSFYGAGGSVAGTATVPEPLTLTAAAMAFGGLGAYVRKRRTVGR